MTEAVQEYQAAVDDLDREVAPTECQLNRPTLPGILLLETPEATPSMLATRLGLTTGSVTTMLNRDARLPDPLAHPTNGRKIVVRLTELTALRW